MKLTESNHALLTFTARLNLWSWGEQVEVALGFLDGFGVVDITSSCLMRRQIADFGKNERNVRRLFDEIDKVLGDESEHVQCLLCRQCDYLLVGIPEGRCPECGHEHSPDDMPRKQEAGTLKNVIVIAIVVSGLEFIAISLLDLFGAGGFLPPILHGMRGGANILCANLGFLLVLVGSHRLMKWFTRRQ